MSQPNEKVIKNLSNKLCLLIDDDERDSNVDICDEINALVAKGANVNFKNSNNDNNTPIHFAIQRNDIKSVETLLRFNLDLCVKNDDELTPLELARLLNYTEMMNLLENRQSADKKLEHDSNQLFCRINELFIHSFECDDFPMAKKKKLNSDPTFKVLKLNNCKNFDDAIRTINNFTSSTHLFVIVLFTKENWSNIHESAFEDLDTRFIDARPLIVQLNHELGIDIFYKERQSSNFTKISNLSPASAEDFLRRLNSNEGMNLLNLLEGIKSNICGAFYENILECKIKKDELRKILSAAAKTDVLSFRFLQLFNDNEESSNDFNLLIDSLHFDGLDNIFTILDLPFEVNMDELKLTEEKRSILEGIDDRGFNILMLLIEQNNYRALEFFLKFNFDLDLVAKNEKTAAELACDLKQYECLVKLIEFDSLYPDEFDMEIVDSTNKTKLNVIVAKIETFHAAIKVASIDIIKSFVSENPHLKFAYNTRNKSAVMIALEEKQFEAYAWLRSFGFISGYYEDPEDVQEALTYRERRRMREINREFFKTSENSHLLYLLSRTKLGFNIDNKAHCIEVIREMYTELDEIPEVQAIMLAIENSDKLEIVFDFNKPHVMDLDPDASTGTEGLTYSKKGVIYVAAGNHEDNFADIMGTIAHELTHYAMQLIFENNCKPYESVADENEDKFNNITVKIHEYFLSNPMSIDQIVENVFKCYSKANWHSELIVRIPHLCARYKKEQKKLKEILNSYCSELLIFYNDKVIKEVIDQRILIKPRKEIQEINSSIGLLPTLQNSDIRLTTTKVLHSESFVINPTSLPIIISSDSPQLSLCLIFQLLYEQHDTKIEFSHIFSRIEALTHKDFASKIENAFNSKVKPPRMTFLSRLRTRAVTPWRVRGYTAMAVIR